MRTAFADTALRPFQTPALLHVPLQRCGAPSRQPDCTLSRPEPRTRSPGWPTAGDPVVSRRATPLPAWALSNGAVPSCRAIRRSDPRGACQRNTRGRRHPVSDAAWPQHCVLTRKLKPLPSHLRALCECCCTAIVVVAGARARVEIHRGPCQSHPPGLTPNCVRSTGKSTRQRRGAQSFRGSRIRPFIVTQRVSGVTRRTSVAAPARPKARNARYTPLASSTAHRRLGVPIVNRARPRD